MFYSSYGSFMHEILEKYYNGKLKKDELPLYFLSNFREKVKGERPSDSTVKKYLYEGLSYLRNFRPFPFDMVAVEKEVEFKIDGYPFVGVIDFLGVKDGDYYIVDNKSRTLKPRSKRKTPTENDKTIDLMLRQLYLYSEAVKEEYGKYPKKLCFNCFRNGVFIEEDFSPREFEKTKEWAVSKIKTIEDTEDFDATDSYFFCRWLCGFNDFCERRSEISES